MSERQWELYRLSVAYLMPDSSYKAAVIEGIENKLKVIEMLEASTAAAMRSRAAAN